MSAVNIPQRLAAAYTDADWSQDIIVCVNDSQTVEDWTGSDVVVNLVRIGTPAHAYELSVGSGLLAPTTEVNVAIRVPKATMADIVPGVYRGEVRRLALDGTIDAAVLFEVAIEAGLSTVQPPATLSPSGPMGQGAGLAVRVVRGNAAPQIIRAGGTAGPRAASRIDRISATAYTLQPGDANAVLVFTSGAPVEVTVPEGLSPVFECELIKDGAGDVYTRGAAGVTVVGPAGRTALVEPFSGGSLKRLDPTVERYRLSGGTGVPPGPGALGLILTPADVIELAGPGVLLANLIGTAGQAPYTFSLVDDDGGRFALDGDKLRTGATQITMADGFERVVTINVTDAAAVTTTISKTLPVLPAASLLGDHPVSGALFMVI